MTQGGTRRQAQCEAGHHKETRRGDEGSSPGLTKTLANPRTGEPECRIGASGGHRWARVCVAGRAAFTVVDIITYERLIARFRRIESILGRGWMGQGRAVSIAPEGLRSTRDQGLHVRFACMNANRKESDLDTWPIHI